MWPQMFSGRESRRLAVSLAAKQTSELVALLFNLLGPLLSGLLGLRASKATVSCAHT